MKKMDARTKKNLDNAKLFGAANRTPMPRPAVFRDRTKYDRKSAKQSMLRYGY